MAASWSRGTAWLRCLRRVSISSSWYAGSVTADVYFCPERQGTYFGSF